MFLAGIAESIENKSKNSTATSTPTLQPSSPRSENSVVVEDKSEVDEDPFDKDDSFFVQCSQALDEEEVKSSSRRSLDSNSNHTFKVPEVKRIASPLIPTTKSLPATSTNAKGTLPKSLPVPTSKSSTATSTSSKPVSSKVDDNFFDDEDDGEFEMLLSQIELPTELKAQSVATTSTSTTSFRSTASVPPPKPVIAPQPGGQNSKVNAHLVKKITSDFHTAL